MNKLTKQLLLLFVVFIVLAALLSNVTLPWQAKKIEELPFNQLVILIEKKQVSEIMVKPDGQLHVTLTDGSEIKSQQIGDDSLIGIVLGDDLDNDLVEKFEAIASPKGIQLRRMHWRNGKPQLKTYLFDQP